MASNAKRAFRLLPLLSAVLLSRATVGSAQGSPSVNATKSPVDAEAIQARETQIEAAFQRADTATLSDALGDDLQFTFGDGLTEGKAGMLSIMSRPGRFTSRTIASFNVETHGDVALTNGRIEIRAPIRGDYTICFVRLYARRGGRWQLISHRSIGEASGWSQACVLK